MVTHVNYNYINYFVYSRKLHLWASNRTSIPQPNLEIIAINYLLNYCLASQSFESHFISSNDWQLKNAINDENSDTVQSANRLIAQVQDFKKL